MKKKMYFQCYNNDMNLSQTLRVAYNIDSKAPYMYI